MPKFITPVTIHNGKRYVAPGTEVELDQNEIDRLIELHGEFGGAALPQDPGNTQVLNVLDKASIDGLNTAATIYGGHGVAAPSLNQRASVVGDKPPGIISQQALPSDADLDQMNKSDLQALAAARVVAIDASDSNAKIIAKLKSSAK